MPKKAKTREENQGPTPETARKLAFDPLLALYRAGTISGTHLHCADEIATAFTLLTLPVSLRISNPGMEVRSNPVGTEARWAETLEKRGKLLDRYKSWRKAMKSKRRGVQIALSIIVDRRSCRSVSRQFQIRDGIAGQIVRAALDVYAINAGYLVGRKAA